MKLGPFELNTVITGDCLKIMAQLPNACVDAIVTDPPYSLGFMGKAWDRFPTDVGPRKPFAHRSREYEMARKPYQDWTTTWATEAYRILKPGAYMLVMGGTRTHHRLGCGLEDAGFLLVDEICWIYATGFCKNYNISKGIDKRLGVERKPVIEADDLFGQRELLDARMNQPSGIVREGRPLTPIVRKITKATSLEAQYWGGYGTALAPAHEPIWLCKKPNEATYVDNVLKYGCGAMNIDGTRIGYEQVGWGGAAGFRHTHEASKHGGLGPGNARPVSGRWPANVLVDCYPEEFIGGVVIEGESKPTSGVFGKQTDIRGGGFGSKRPSQGEVYAEQVRYGPRETSVGDGLLREYTRFFVIPKPSKTEKNKGCEKLYYRLEEGHHIRIDRAEWIELVKEEMRILKETGKRVSLQARGNIHVTVKPVRLGMWLTKLITPHQHSVVVLDPFCGSGSFSVSALRLDQEEGYLISYLGIDKDANSIEITEARLKAEKQDFRQTSLL